MLHRPAAWLARASSFVCATGLLCVLPAFGLLEHEGLLERIGHPCRGHVCPGASTVSQRLPKQTHEVGGQRGTDRPQSYCSCRGSLPAPRSRHHFKASYRRLSLWHRHAAKDIACLTRRPTRYSAGGRTGDPRGWSVSHDAVIRAYRELCVRDRPSCTAPPRAPRPSPREQTVCSSRPHGRGMQAFYRSFGERA